MPSARRARRNRGVGVGTHPLTPAVQAPPRPYDNYAQTGVGWLVTGAALDELYPCRCDLEDPDPALWKVERARRSHDPRIYLCDPYQKKGSAEWRNRCFCWGRLRDDRLPEGCCAYSAHSPRYSVTVEGVRLASDETPGPEESAPGRAPQVHAEVEPGDDQMSVSQDGGLEIGQVYADETGDHVVIRMPYIPRWTAAERTCECKTPWDAEKRVSGWHCTGCCTNWRNLGVGMGHLRRLPGGRTQCRDPRDMVDVGPGPTTGAPVVRMRMEGMHVVWG
jgi:hypothetical protein